MRIRLTTFKLNIARISSIVRYIFWSDAPYKWKLCKGDCPLCGPTTFLSLKKDPFLTRCLKCKANITNLSLIPVIKNHFKGIYQGKKAYELSSYGSTLEWLKKYFDEVVYSEYFANLPSRKYYNGILNQDVQNLTFEDECFDVVTSNQVFEHVPNDEQGYFECFRVLKKGGALIFSVPLYMTEHTEKIAYLDNDQIRFLGRPEYHDSRIGGGAKSAPVFWRLSINDITQRVKACGFSSVDIIDVTLSNKQGTPSRVVYAVK